MRSLFYIKDIVYVIYLKGDQNNSLSIKDIGENLLNQFKKSSNKVDYSFNNSIIDAFNYFWRNVNNRNLPILDNFQDSSFIVFDVKSHPRTIKVLKNIIFDFNIGYGDKEIYW